MSSSSNGTVTGSTGGDVALGFLCNVVYGIGYAVCDAAGEHSCGEGEDGGNLGKYFDCLEAGEYGSGPSTDCSYLVDAQGHIEDVQSPEHQAGTEAADETLHSGCTPTGEQGCQVGKIGGAEEDTAEAIEEELAKAYTDAEKKQTAADSRRIASAEDDVAKRAAYRAARNEGANRAAASALSGTQTQEGNTTNALTAARNAAGSTQNDYLAKIGYANQLEREGENIRKSAVANSINAGFQGAAAGAATGASLGGGR